MFICMERFRETVTSLMRPCL